MTHVLRQGWHLLGFDISIRFCGDVFKAKEASWFPLIAQLLLKITIH